jgi:hypothetical protein
VPTPALVAPIEFTLRADLYAALGGHVEHAVTLAALLAQHGEAAEASPFWPATPGLMRRDDLGRSPAAPCCPMAASI